MSSKALYQTNQILFRKNQMNKQQRKIRELRARFVTKLTKQTKVLRATDYVRTPGGHLIDITLRKKEQKWVDTYNKWYQFVGRNPKQAADEIRMMTVSQKNKFFFCLEEWSFFNPYGNHFEEKFAMMTFVLSKPKTLENFLSNKALLKNSFSIMQKAVDNPGYWHEDFFLADCKGAVRSKLNNLQIQGIDYLKNPTLGN